MNVHDNLKSMSVEDIQKHYDQNSMNAAVGMTHISGDFNLGNVIRSANFFGFKEVFYVGGSKQYDRRSTVGTHHYIPINFVKTEDEFLNSIENKYSLICIENNIPRYSHRTESIFSPHLFVKETLNSYPALFLFGEEQIGISEFLLDASDYIITIPAFGTVRSLNVGSCAAIVMAMYRQYQDMG